MADYTDTDRMDWLAEQFRTSTVYMDGQHPWSPHNFRLAHLRGPTFRAAVDAAMEKNHWQAAAGVTLPDGAKNG